MSKRDYLVAELARNIKWFEDESTKHKGLHRALRYAAFGLTAASTASASLALAFPLYQSPVNLIIIVLTVGVGVVTSIEGLRKPGELWIHERTILYSLRDLKRDLEYQLAEDTTPAAVDDIFGKMQMTLSSSREKWSRQVVGNRPRSSQANVQDDRLG